MDTLSSSIIRLLLFVLLTLGAAGLAACANSAPAPAAATPEKVSSLAPPSKASTKSLPKIVAFGDSLTAGYGLPTSESYPAQLQQKLAADGLEYEVVNAGVSGDTSAGGVRRIDWALEGDVKVVILELGANDILRGQPVEQMKKNLSHIIERAQAKGADVLLAGMEAPTNTGIDYRKQVHEAFPELARKYNAPLIPFFLEGVAGIESLNLADGIHPNAAGTKMVTERVYEALRPLLEKQNGAAAR